MLQGMKTMPDTNNNDVLKRQVKALELKLQGESSREIAKQLKVSHSTIIRDIKTAIANSYEANNESINFQRNKITGILNKILDSQMKYAIGFEEVTGKSILGIPATYDPEEEEYDYHYLDSDKNKVGVERHSYMEDHHDSDGYQTCNCKYEGIKKSAEEISEIKKQWHSDNVTFRPPSMDAIKVILEVTKQLGSIWGINISMPKEPNYYDQRQQTIQIKGESNE